MKKIIICDFEDSFTYNILSELQLMGLSAQVVELPRIRESLSQQLKQLKDSDKLAIILGPGPGHPSEYLFIQDLVLQALERPNVFIMGICLGHQLLWYFLGAKVVHSVRPIHGQVVHYQLDSQTQAAFGLPDSISVQRYNSLAVVDKNWEGLAPQLLASFSFEGEVIMGRFKNAVSYQFHPESVGTSFPSLFFHPVKKFLL